MARPALIALAFLGCAASTGSALRPQEIETNGRRRYEADAPRVFKATLGALRAQGYSIAFSDGETGVIHTMRKRVAYARAGRDLVYWSRQYQVAVQPLGPAATQVTVVPHLYEGEQDASGGEEWELEDERQMWFNLFRQIDQFLSAPAVIPQVAPGL